MGSQQGSRMYSILPDATGNSALIEPLNSDDTVNGAGLSGLDYWTLDFLIPPTAVTSKREDQKGSNASLSRSHLALSSSDSEVLGFLKQCVVASDGDPKWTAIRFIFPATEGSVVRCDFLERRLECCEHVKTIKSFLSPRQIITGIPERNLMAVEICDILPAAMGAILVQNPGQQGLHKTLRVIDDELKNRLSFSWALPEPIPQKRVAWVQGREDIESSRRAYEAARALGISIVMIENPGHWLEDDNGPYANLREAFIPVDIEIDEGFPVRIVDAVRQYPHPIDGVMTISDVRLPGVAKACEMLGLPTSPYEAYAIAADKAKTKMLELYKDEFFTVSSVEDLQKFLDTRREMPLQFPLIVKPCRGWNSDCVARVSNEEELVEAVHRASIRHADAASPSTAVLIEPYIDGPEVDANFVLLDNELVFFDINDDFPSRGDAIDARPNDNFQETQNVLPTALPQDEVAILRDSIHQSIMRQGFSTGIFHCEARVRNSRVHYATRNEILDLETKPEPPQGDVSVYLMEINARPPGYLETVAVLLTYGVDYYALRLLMSLGPSENARVRALSQPFLMGPQFHLSAMIVQQDRAGVMKTRDAGAEFLRNYPQLAEHIPDYKTQMRGGAVLEGPSASSLWWIAYFSVFSRKSRQDCLRQVQYIENNFTYELEE
ncbi:hypothetical protein FQN57_000253 [Myotisia sp. PD_48]|nr:hypothetical protein FQN57_000253 [Myotisia sp. PD_48]